MPLFRKSVSFLAIVALSALSLSCRAKLKPVQPVVAAPDPRIEQYVAQGDAYLLESHLFGWRRAEASYRQAFELAPTALIQDKLLLAQFLVMTRQFDEDIALPDETARLEALCAAPQNARRLALCELAHRYRAGPDYWYGDQGKPSDPKPSPFDGTISALEAYLHSLWVTAFRIEEPREEAAARRETYRESPLFMYLNVGKESGRAAELENKVPQFAELFAFVGESHFQKSRFNAARTWFQKTLDLIPDYSRALNGLGNIYFFAMEEYSKALELYETTLRSDPDNTAALFGKGAALHHLERYFASNAALERTLKSDLSRKGRAGLRLARYYRGETNYYRAYNFYLIGDRTQSRQIIDAAKQDLSDSEQILYLSGVLYFDEGRKDLARDEFLKVVKLGSSNCSAQYYLGSIYHEQKDPVAATHFLGACACVEATVRNLQHHIRSVPTLDLEPDEKTALKEKLEKKLVAFRSSSTSMIEAMIRQLADSEAGRWARDSMTEMLARVRP